MTTPAASGPEITNFALDLDSVPMGKHRHDLVNALTAVEGAARILARESLSPADRSILVSALDTGLNQLRALLFGPPNERREQEAPVEEAPVEEAPEEEDGARTPPRRHATQRA